VIFISVSLVQYFLQAVQQFFITPKVIVFLKKAIAPSQNNPFSEFPALFCSSILN